MTTFGDRGAQASKNLFRMLPKDQIDRVLNQKNADIEPEMLGFVHIYEHLSKIIPEHFTVVDLGCDYNAQCFLFPNHKKYIAVDNFNDTERFISDNCKIYKISIARFIKNHLKDLNMKETFAICSYVPPWGDDNMKLVRENFKNVFTYYPHGGYKDVKWE